MISYRRKMSEGFSPQPHLLNFTFTQFCIKHNTTLGFTDPADIWGTEVELLHDPKLEKLLSCSALTPQLPFCAARRLPPKYRETSLGCQINPVPECCLSSIFSACCCFWVTVIIAYLLKLYI